MFSIFLSNKKCRLEHVVNKLMSCLINEFLWILITNCREWISNFMDTPWNSIKFHGTPSILQGTRWNSMELQGQSMEFHGITWTSVELHGIPWNSIDTPWNSMEIHGYSMELHGIPWNSMELHKYSMKLHGYSMEPHGSFMEIHGIPWIYSMEVFHTGNSWFSLDVTKIQTKKLSLLLSFYLYVVLQHLKTFIQKKKFGSKGFFVLRHWTLQFPGFCVTRQLADAQEKLLCELKTFIYRFWEILLSKDSLFQNKYYFEFHFYGFLKRRIHALVGKLKNRCFCWFLAAIFVPLKGTQTWRLHTKLYKFG